MPYRALRRRPVARRLRPADWDLLVRLPGRVLLAAVSAGASAGDGGPAGDPLAGLDAIAAGRSSPSAVVSALVTVIFAERAGTDRAGFTEAEPASEQLLADARAAVRTLDRRATPADAAAYRDWLADIAAAGCGDPATPGGRRFQVDLLLALHG